MLDSTMVRQLSFCSRRSGGGKVVGEVVGLGATELVGRDGRGEKGGSKGPPDTPFADRMI